jgi:DNA invertase Pin-like site-specific DNA recombinase
MSKRTLPTRKHCFIYCRISQDREGRKLGVERQERTCRELAERLGYEVMHVYIENDISASTRSKKPRPQFADMMKRAVGVDAILAYSSGRLTRRPRENEDLIELYEEHGTLIHYANAKDNDLSTARGRSRARDDARRDAEEAEEIGERVKEDTDRRAREGAFHGGSRGFGWTEGRKDLDPYEHPIFLTMVDMALAGESLRAISRWLYERRVPTVTWHPPMTLKPWPRQVIRDVLINPRIAGLRVHRGQVAGKAQWPPLVPEETWRQLEALLTDASRATLGAVPAARVHLLTGLARCYYCDRPITTRSTSSTKRGRLQNYHCAPCGWYRQIEPIDIYVAAVTVRMLEEYRDEPEAVNPEIAQTVRQLRDKIDATRAEFENDDTMTPQQLRETLRNLRRRLQAEEAKLAPPRRHLIIQGAAGAEAGRAWEGLSIDRKRALINALIEVRILRGVGGRSFRGDSVRIDAR